MTAKELDIMVNAMRTKHNKIESRLRLEDQIYYLSKGLRAIGRNEIAEELDNLYSEIDAIDTDKLIEVGTFR